MKPDRICETCDEWWTYPGSQTHGKCRLLVTYDAAHSEEPDQSDRHWSETCGKWVLKPSPLASKRVVYIPVPGTRYAISPTFFMTRYWRLQVYLIRDQFSPDPDRRPTNRFLGVGFAFGPARLHLYPVKDYWMPF